MTETVEAGRATEPQRELLRRLAVDGGAVADLVLRTPVGGRGRVEPTATDRELLRVAVSVIAAWAGSAPPAPATARDPRPAPWRRGVVVAGASPQAERVRAAVRATGRGSDGWKPTVLVVGGSLDSMLAQHWRQRVDRGAGLRWRRVWATAAARDALPPAVDLARLAEGWSERVGVDRVHVVLASEQGAAVVEAGRVLGLPLGHGPGARPDADPVGTDLLRRLNQVLATTSLPARVRLHGSDLAEVLDGDPRDPRNPLALGVPRGFLDWALTRAEQLARRLDGAAYHVHGDPRAVVPSTGPGTVRSVDPARTLERALAVLQRIEGGDAWRRG